MCARVRACARARAGVGVRVRARARVCVYKCAATNVTNNTGCFKKSFTTLKAYRNLYRGSYSPGFFLMGIR